MVSLYGLVIFYCIKTDGWYVNIRKLLAAALIHVLLQLRWLNFLRITPISIEAPRLLFSSKSFFEKWFYSLSSMGGLWDLEVIIQIEIFHHFRVQQMAVDFTTFLNFRVVVSIISILRH